MSFVSNALAIAGFIILTFIIMWGVVHIASLSNFSVWSWLRSAPKVEITAPKNATSSEPITISWKITPTSAGSAAQAGSYSFLYKCEKGFEFTTQGRGGAVSRVPCGASINVASSTAAVLVPVLSGMNSVSVPISIFFTPSATGTRAEGSATIVIAPKAQAQPAVMLPVQKPATQTPAKPVVKKSAPTYSYKAKRPAANLVAHAASGPADLRVVIIAIGVIDPSSGALINRAPTSPYDIVGVEFDIANIGGTKTNTWYFQALLPIPAPSTYTSVEQIPLAPGEHIVNTLRFSQAIRGGTFTVIVDPIGQVVESIKTNNQAAIVMY